MNNTPNLIPPQPLQKDHSGCAIASLIVGVFNLSIWLLPICGFPLGITGIILGIVGIDSSNKKLAMMGLIFSIIGLILAGAATIGGLIYGSLTGFCYFPFLND
jgi:hypothetical protein